MQNKNFMKDWKCENENLNDKATLEAMEMVEMDILRTFVTGRTRRRMSSFTPTVIYSYHPTV